MKKQKKAYPLTSQDFFLEEKRNALLCSLYEKNFHTARLLTQEIIKYADNRSQFTETDEKLLNQIQLILKKLGPSSGSYYLKFKEYSKTLKQCIALAARQSSRNICYIDFQVWEEKLGLNKKQKELLYKTAMTFQLTSGCSHFCRRCNEWALPGVRSHFSHSAIFKILNLTADHKNSDISLYGASDPLDWEEHNKDISDIIEYIKKLPVGHTILTKVPKKKQSLLKKLLQIDSNLSVSVTSKNRSRIQKIQNDLGVSISKQHDFDDLLIPAGQDEDFISVKPSITDGYGTEITPEAAFIVIPAFTSPIHPFGHKKISITSETKFFPKKTTGRNALLTDYFKPLKGYDLNKNLYHLDYLLDAQIESIILDNGQYSLTPPGMRSVKEYLSIFDEIPRLQRKKMTSAVFKGFKKQFLFNTSFKNMPDKNRKLYLKKINAHLKLCRKKECTSHRLYAISFFLESISAYVPKNPVKTKIMQSLLTDKIETFSSTFINSSASNPLENLFMDPDIDCFNVFRLSVFCLLNNSNDKFILEFIQSWPAAYDPEADIFAQQ